MLARRLEGLAAGDPEYWSFEERDRRDLVHSLFQYPAMMVPLLQRELLETCVRWDPSIRTVYDPFMGSGTVMTEAMLQGLDFVGGDINPLAALVSQAKVGSFDSARLEIELRRLLKRARADTSGVVGVSFPGLQKWFTEEVAAGLGRLRRAIGERRQADVRRFYWVALAETVRLTSNSRTSTVKLHMRPADEVASRPDPLGVFEEVSRRSLRVLAQQQALLDERGLLKNARYVGEVLLQIGDVADSVPQVKGDLLMSSPPYGDNHTTVTYGQAAYLPLHWIDRRDIIGLHDDTLVENTHRIDSRSLGGSRVGALAALEALLDRSPHLRGVVDSLGVDSKDARKRLGAFYRDLDARLVGILERLRDEGVLVWTTGDRRVSGVVVPMASILRELLGRRVELVTTLDRTIPATRKRMAPRNSSTVTMGSETILVVRKSDGRT